MPRLLACLLVLSACNACDDDHEPAVPFGVDTGAEHGAAERPETPHVPRFQERVGETFPRGTRRVAIQGAPIETDEGDIRGVLAVDLDDDGDRDALIVRELDGTAALLHARRDGSTFAPARVLTQSPAAIPGCTASEIAMRTISKEYAIATWNRACPGVSAPDRNVWIVSVEAQPRLRESVTLLPEDGRAPGEVSIAIRTADSDGDGHGDVLLDVSVTPEDAASPASVSIAWLDRPGGLARDTAEPEASMAAAAERAAGSLARDPMGALATARGVLALHAVLCRETGAPRIALGGTEGIACRASEGAGRAAAVAAAALAQQGNVFGALQARERLEDPAYRVPARDRRRAEAALAGLAVTEGVTVIEGPAALAGATPNVHLPLVGFSDADTLVVRGAAPMAYHVGEDGMVPEAGARVSGALVITDPSERWAVVDVDRTCDGHVLVIVRATEVVAGVVAGRPVAQPLLEARSPPPGSACPSALPATARRDDGGWRIAGWAPQGVVAIRGNEVRVVPLTTEAQPAGEPSALEPTTPVPAPLPPGMMSPNGNAYALATPVGIVVRQGADAKLIRPASYTPDIDAVAVSPDGRRVAFVAGGKVQVATVP